MIAAAQLLHIHHQHQRTGCRSTMAGSVDSSLLGGLDGAALPLPLLTSVLQFLDITSHGEVVAVEIESDILQPGSQLRSQPSSGPHARVHGRLSNGRPLDCVLSGPGGCCHHVSFLAL